MPAMSISDADLLDARILLVDDQPANLQLLGQMLAAAGYRDVRSTFRPQEVLELHRQHDFDLIVLDLQMPGMDGFQVMEQLHALGRDPYLPVLVLTAQPSQKLRALQAGARDFVGKPFELVELQTRIRNMVEVRLLHRRLAAHNEQLEQAVSERTAELRESEARFQRLLELATDWYWEQDAEGRFTHVSGPALEMLGLTGDAAGAWVADAQAALGEKMATRRPFLDFIYRRVLPDGSEQVLQASGEPSFDAAGRFRGYRGIGTDITARAVELRRQRARD
jgi:PAS domain S-box-containing protein